MDEPSVRTLARGFARWALLSAVALVVVAIVQSVRHPARLWSPGLMGRVLAWGVEPSRTDPEAASGYPAP